MGGDPDFGGEIYRIEADGTGLLQLTTLGPGGDPGPLFGAVAGPHLPTVSGDGATIAFSHNGDPTGGNPDLGRELFAVDDDGSNLRQLTAATTDTSICDYPQLVAHGSAVVFRCNADLLGGGGPAGFQIFKVNPDGSGVVQLTSANREVFGPRVDDLGVWVVFHSSWDPFGSNADGSSEIFRVRTDGSGLEQLTDTLISSYQPDISGDGSLVAFIRDDEVFTHDVVSGAESQLTIGADAVLPTLSRDGTWVYYTLAAFETDLYRVRAAGGLVERVGGLTPFESVNRPFRFPEARPFEVDHDGDRFAVSLIGNPADDNFDGDSEIFLVDRSASPSIAVSPGPAPTTVSWPAMSGPVRYDVVRGDTANLDLPGGGVSDLGPVVCLDENSRDARSADSDEPLPGQVFFYLFRPVDINGMSGSYGQAFDGSERAPGSGGCID
jgi:hypothetical protein